MEKIRVLAYAYEFQEMFFSKDIFLIPYYIAKELGGECKYLYTKNLGNTEIPNAYRGVSVVCTKSSNLWKVFLQEIDASTIDVLFLTGSSAVHMAAVYFFKKRNPRLKVVVFGDMEEIQARELSLNGFCYSGGFIGWVKKKLADYFFLHVVYLVANIGAYHLMDKLCKQKQWKKVVHFYPCLDDEKFKSYNMKRRPFSEKENIMVCVGRIGCYQKNTELLLNALRKVDLKDWKIYMLGPITTSFDLKENGGFQKIIDQFFLENPNYKGKLVFTGMIYNQREVFEYYNRAKVLLMTSRHESWGNVYSEAAALGCYILSTDVGGATLCSNYWKFGYKLQQEDADGLALVINEIVDGKIVMNTKASLGYNDLCYSNLVKTELLPKIGIEPRSIK